MSYFTYKDLLLTKTALDCVACFCSQFSCLSYVLIDRQVSHLYLSFYFPLSRSIFLIMAPNESRFHESDSWADGPWPLIETPSKTQDTVGPLDYIVCLSMFCTPTK